MRASLAVSRGVLPVLLALLPLFSAACDRCAFTFCFGTHPPECGMVDGCADARSLAVCGSTYKVRINECCSCTACRVAAEPCPAGQSCEEHVGLLFGVVYGECVGNDLGWASSVDTSVPETSNPDDANDLFPGESTPES